jgi:hypothetical protein
MQVDCRAHLGQNATLGLLVGLEAADMEHRMHLPQLGQLQLVFVVVQHLQHRERSTPWALKLLRQISF